MRIFRLQLSKLHAVILGVLVFLSVAAAGGVALLLPPVYETSGSIVVIGPNIGDDGKITNPYLNFTNATYVTADLLRQSSLRPSTVAAIEAKGGTNSYQVTGSLNNSEPTLTITAQADNPQQAIATTKLVMDSVGTDFAARQAAIKVDTSRKARITTLTDPGTITRVWKKAIEYGAAVFAAGLVASALVVVLLDRRRRKKEGVVGVGGSDNVLVDAADERSSADVSEPSEQGPAAVPAFEPAPSVGAARAIVVKPVPTPADESTPAPAASAAAPASDDGLTLPNRAAEPEPFTPRRSTPRGRPAPRVRPHPVQPDERDMSFTRLSSGHANGHGSANGSSNGGSANGHGSSNGQDWPTLDIPVWPRDAE